MGDIILKHGKFYLKNRNDAISKEHVLEALNQLGEENDRLRKDFYASVNRCQEAEGSLLEKAGLGRAILASMVDRLEKENDRLRAEVDRLGKQLDSWCRWYGEGTDEAPHVADARQEERDRAAGMVEEEYGSTPASQRLAAKIRGEESATIHTLRRKR